MSSHNLIEIGQLPSVGNDVDEGDKERDEEEEKLRREAIKEAEEKRRIKHKKMEEERESLRQGIRDKVLESLSKISMEKVLFLNREIRMIYMIPYYFLFLSIK